MITKTASRIFLCICVTLTHYLSEGTCRMKPFDYAVKIFETSPSSSATINSFNGVNLTGSIIDIGFSPFTNNLYLCAKSQSKIVEFDQNFNYLNSINITSPYSVEFLQNNYYITGGTNRLIYKTDLNFTVTKTYNAPPGANMMFIRYSKSSNKLYACDSGLKQVRVFDTDLNNISSFSVIDCTSVIPLDNDIVYLGSKNKSLHVYQNESHVRSYNICLSGTFYGMYTDVHSNGTRYLMISCMEDKKVYLYTIEGTAATNTNKSISTTGYPFGLAVDKDGRLAVSRNTPEQIDIFSSRN